MLRSLSFRQRLASPPRRRFKKLFKTARQRLPSQHELHGPDNEVAQLPQPRRQRQRQSFKRWFVLLWKRFSRPNRARQSGRFSFVPPGFTFVSISMTRKRDSREIRRARRFGVFFEEIPFSLRGLV
ncbi:uncharacterized protein BT62DRAFT_1077715 [Guyanagaster necrorhizus]|uniref:Uncharacterized protein n=1 Tax=Guyanagaster necrorhizus TaxID=856835 RepID=A0A9P7VQ14_9AGAR|nr:uncharacterized protein BT62DRAFT_1077715 [Guyanagaster necrorhizus MCA 3950]KAG7444375.1 hypothetical protein BT62DRAFT_1077715 [Guyanagaster necrorhizus MCA 3950]